MRVAEKPDLKTSQGASMRGVGGDLIPRAKLSSDNFKVRRTTLNQQQSEAPPSSEKDEPSDRRSLKRVSLLLIDSTALRRECLAQVLRSGAREFEVESVARPEDACVEKPLAVMLNIKSARISEELILNDIATLRRRFGNAVPLVILGDGDAAAVAEVIRYGLRGYIPTSVSATVVIAAIRLVLAGGLFVPPNLIEDYANQESAAVSSDNTDRVTFLGLTQGEVQVLEKLQHGKANKMIAYELDLPENVVKNHVRRIVKKLRATSRRQVARLSQERLSASE
jgi:DNA-binding NarL/FixJ family response regulator